MTSVELVPGSWCWLEVSDVDRLLTELVNTGHRVVGPQVADGAVVYRDLAGVADLPHGWLDEQDGGSYRLRHDPAAGTFDHVVGPHSLKNFLFPPRETIASVHSRRWLLVAAARGPTTEPPLAVIGVRACDLEALRIQDRVFMGGDHVDPAYAARRERLFIVAVNCRRAAATCFCHSMGCGPAARPVLRPRPHRTRRRGRVRFACEVGSDARGGPAAEPVGCTRRLLGRGGRCRPAGAGGSGPADARTPEAEPVAPRPRSLDTEGIRDLLFDNLEHPRWEEVASRCLSCTNCTLVCPTCFCASVTEVADLSGDHVDRERHWAELLHARSRQDARPQRAELDRLAVSAVAHPQARRLDRPVRLLGLHRLRPLHHLVPGGHRHHRGGGGDPARLPGQAEPGADGMTPTPAIIPGLRCPADVRPPIPGGRTRPGSCGSRRRCRACRPTTSSFTDPAVGAAYRFAAGQFNMLYLPGIGEAAISISSDAATRAVLAHTVRAVGNVTDALARLGRRRRAAAPRPVRPALAGGGARAAGMWSWSAAAWGWPRSGRRSASSPATATATRA